MNGITIQPLWIPNFPAASGTTYSRGIAKYVSINEADGLNAFKLTRFGSEKLPENHYEHKQKLDGSSIDEPRVNPNIATNVLIHIGGTYSVFGYDHLGGSYGCFWIYTQRKCILFCG